MIHSFITFIEQIVLPMGALGVFFAEIIEEVIVPIPSALVLLTSGFIFLKGEFSVLIVKDLLFVIAIPGALGLTVGSLVIYYLSFYGGKPFIEKFGSFLGIEWQEVLDFDEKMNKSKYDEFLFVFARIIPVVPSSLVAIFSGVTRMPVKKYTILTLLGSFIKALIYGFVGYLVGDLYRAYAYKIAGIEKVGLIVCAVLFVLFILYRVYKKYYK
jgi:membrane protein DedA with SNARE-associated domain